MPLNAEKIVNDAEQILPGLKFAARLTGIQFLQDAMVVLERAVNNPESKQQLIAWLRWTPLFTAGTGQPQEGDPALPESFEDIEQAAISFKTGCQNCDDVEDCQIPTDPSA